MPKTAVKPAAKTAPRRRTRRRKPTQEAIAARAYELFESEGGGHHVDHWLRAERELSAG